MSSTRARWLSRRSAASAISALCALCVVAGCRGRVPAVDVSDGGEGEGEGELDPAAVAALVTLGDAVAVDGGGPSLAVDRLPRPPQGIVAVDLGALAVDARGTTGAIAIEIVDQVRALAVVAYADDADAVVVPVRAEADGAVLIDDIPLAADAPGEAQIAGLSRGFTGQFSSPWRVLPARGEGAFYFPATPDVPLPRGPLRVALGQFDVSFDADRRAVRVPRPGAVRVVVLLRTASAAAGRVGLAVHLTGAAGLTAKTAPTHAALQSALGLVDEVYGDVGVATDDVAYLDLPDGELAQTIVLDEPLCEGAELDAVVARGVPDRLNVVIVDRFECGVFGPFLLGFATGLPSVPWARSARAGVVVAASTVVDEPDLFGFALAHEVGHALGLFHAKENDRFGQDIYDQLADTPNDNELVRENLMYFDVSRFAEPVLSRGQGDVVRHGPWVLP